MFNNVPDEDVPEKEKKREKRKIIWVLDKRIDANFNPVHQLVGFFMIFLNFVQIHGASGMHESSFILLIICFKTGTMIV